jgi:hypothetical protein
MEMGHIVHIVKNSGETTVIDSSDFWMFYCGEGSIRIDGSIYPISDKYIKFLPEGEVEVIELGDKY